MSSASPVLCEVCNAQPFKYKCPACLLKTCSLPCTKAHKEKCPGKTGPSAEKPVQTSATTPSSEPAATSSSIPDAAPSTKANPPTSKDEFAPLLESPRIKAFIESEDGRAFLRKVLKTGYYRGGWDEDRALKEFLKDPQKSAEWTELLGKELDRDEEAQ